MCCLVVEIIMFVMGIVGITKGTVAVTRRRVTTGTPARVAGALLLVPLPAYVLANVVAGASLLGQADHAGRASPVVGVVALFALGVSAACFLSALILCIATARPIKPKPRVPEDYDEPFEQPERPPSAPPDERIQPPPDDRVQE